jgi:hypothetical protein
VNFFGGKEIDPVRKIRRIHVEKRKVAEPPLVVIVAMSDDQPFDPLEPMASYLLEERRTAVQKKTGATYGYLIPDALAHHRKGAIVTQDANCDTVNHRRILAQAPGYKKLFVCGKASQIPTTEPGVGGLSFGQN